MNAVQIIRHASRIADEREELAYALREIERVKIMDSLSAIRMRSIARVTLKNVKLERDGHEPVASVLRRRADARAGAVPGAAAEVLIMGADINLPHNGWLARPHQIPLWQYLQHDHGKRAIAIWHRRAGKDEVAMHFAACSIMQDRAMNAWHCLPEYSQGRKAIWTAVNSHTGKRRIDEAFRASCAPRPTTPK